MHKTLRHRTDHHKEATLRDINLPDDEAAVIRAMIDYIYTGDYVFTESSHHISPLALTPAASSASSSSNSKMVETESELLFHVKVYVVGDKYDIPALKTLAKQKFAPKVAHDWNTCSFSEAIKLLWENTVDSDHELREIVVDVAQKHIEVLLDRGEFVELMEANGSFCLEILKQCLARGVHPLQLENRTAYLPYVEKYLESPVHEDETSELGFFGGKSKKGKKKLGNKGSC